jgi:NTE family protein
MSDARTAGDAKKRLTLALQGGGAHGAFTWGVLDRLLEEPRLEVEAISGTSAGAMNAALYAYGLQQGGPAAAQTALHDFWHSVSRAGGAVFDAARYLEGWPAMKAFAAAWGQVLTHVWSPYDNPLYANPLRALISAAIDFDKLRRCEKPRVFVCATNVRSNERKVFSGDELSADALLASACMPTLFQAVEIGGEHYWDGGYMGNPALEPLLEYCPDILIVQVNALRRDDLPDSAAEIVDRLNEITFNAALVNEIRTISAMNKLLERGQLVNTTFRPIRFHAIEGDEEMSRLGSASKSRTDWSFLQRLRDLGRAAATAWLADPACFACVGETGSVDVERKFISRARGSS